MKKINTQNAVFIPLFSDKAEPQDFDVYVFGSNEPSDKEKDTFRKALKRYLADYNVSPTQLAELTGISRTSIYYYLSDTRQISFRCDMYCSQTAPDKAATSFLTCRLSDA